MTTKELHETVAKQSAEILRLRKKVSNLVYPSIFVDEKKRFFALRQNGSGVRLEEVDEFGNLITTGRIARLQGASKLLAIIDSNSLGLKPINLPFEEEE